MKYVFLLNLLIFKSIFLFAQGPLNKSIHLGIEFGSLYNEISYSNDLDFNSGTFGIYLGGVSSFKLKGELFNIVSGIRYQMREWH